MSKHKNLKRNLLICLLAGSAVMYTLPLHAATSVVANNALPSGGSVIAGDIQIPEWAKPSGTNSAGNLEMNITQNSTNGIISWGSFDVGGSATVNFKGPESGYNTLNYVNGGNMSQIYGTINANNNGNIFIVNPAGVQIGNSAQINVGRLYVSNNEMSDADFTHFMNNANPNDIINYALQGESTEAALMSLGNINANHVTFEGDGRIVIDSERIKNAAGSAVNNDFEVHINDDGNVLIGYDAYVDKDNNNDNLIDGYVGQDKIFSNNVYVNGKLDTNVKGYMWVEDVEQLQAINTNLSGNYALRNSIDATSTATDTAIDTFISIGDHNNEFTGKFDGLDYSIFELNIDSSGKDYAGRFGVTNGAVINNVTIVGGNISGGSSVGAVVGYARDTIISNVINSASVTGDAEVGGIVGTATGSAITNAVNTGTVHSNGEQNTNVSNAGGLIGYMYNGTLDGNSYNLGNVSGDWDNVGGLVGHAVNSTIGDGTNLVYNRMDVTGAYNVGGIVGNMAGSTVQNAENSGTVEATGYTTEDYTYHTAHYASNANYTVNGVYAANAGGIAGTSSDDSTITDVLNTADVSSSQKDGNDYYDAGNVGGIVGKAVDTNITNATNQENEIRGAHNVGGVAGYFGNSSDDSSQDYTVTNGINDGGDIMATGARNASGFVQEWVRSGSTGGEEAIIGNMGGIVGYMDGNNVYITGSANRGTVHSMDIVDVNNVAPESEAANTGGIVGKIDRDNTKTLEQVMDKNDKYDAAVTDSYNTGDVKGYTAVGGVVGMMYNGEVMGSYNLGNINTTRKPGNTTNAHYSVNMGGVVGDTTEGTNASALIYDVYNKGQIGDDEFNFYARHVGGVVGRLSGRVVKAYNTGAIYNGYNVVGGIAGWVATGTISNAFNTGNITVISHENSSTGTQVGGIAGAAHAGKNVIIDNVYNLGTLRSFAISGIGTGNSLGGILGTATQNGTVTISNAYTTGNLYAGISNDKGKTFTEDKSNNVNSIYGSLEWDAKVNANENTYYIKPALDENNKPLFTELTGDRNNANKAIDFTDKDNSKNYEFDGGITSPDKTTGNVDENSAWRIYDGNTPILNAFLPDSEKYFEKNGLTDNSNNPDKTFNGSIQYGTAYDPLLTIINTDRDLVFNFGTKDNGLSITNAAGLAVYGGGVTLNNFTTSSGSGYFGGTIYADGALNLNGGVNDIGLGSAADIYGSAVNITTDGKVTIYGDVTATGNRDNGTTEGIDTSLKVDGAGNITISASDVDVYGTLTSASNTQGANVTIPGIENSAVTWTPGVINNPYASMADIADRFAHTTGDSAVDGNITITANGAWNDADNDNIKDEGEVTGGNVNLYFGNKEQGLTTTGGNLTITGTGDVYVDSDLDIGGNLTLNGTGADSEVVLDITNIGQVQAKNGTVTDAVTGLHNFMHHFSNTDGGGTQAGHAVITLNAEQSGDAKLAVDMWDYESNSFDLKKYDSNGHTFKDELDEVTIRDIDNNELTASEVTYIWVTDADQLQGINNNGTDGLEYNYALKGDINASGVNNYEAIGTGSNTGFTGTFDGRGNRIIGLTVDKVNGENTANAGIFSTVGEGGVVKDVNIYSGTFTGTTTAGAVAGVNNGRIEGIVTFGNTVTVTGNNGKAGGIVGINNAVNGKIVTNEDGTITLEPVDRNKPVTGIIDVESTGSVIAGNTNAIAGGLVGTNNGTLGNSYSNSAVTANIGTGFGLGGVVGVNTENGNVSLVDSLGVTNGGAHLSNKVGGVIGINNGTLNSAYNESIVSGKDKVGGIIGNNTGTVTNIVNASSVDGFDTENASSTMAESNYVGGLVGTNSGSVTNGRNNGTITGTNYVGGMVGNNADEHSILTNLVNDSSAAIEGERYVGGIAGSNSGTITADKKMTTLLTEVL